MSQEVLQKLDQVLSEQRRQGGILEQLIRMVGATNAEIKEIKNDIKTINEKLDMLTDGQDRHERMLELLSKRSIEQEAEIKDIRRR